MVVVCIIKDWLRNGAEIVVISLCCLVIEGVDCVGNMNHILAWMSKKLQESVYSHVCSHVVVMFLGLATNSWNGNAWKV